MQKLEPKGRRDADPDPSEQAAAAKSARERLIRELDRLAAEAAEQMRRDAAPAEPAAAPAPETGLDGDDTPSASAPSTIPGR
jgi:hypothetical protein